MTETLLPTFAELNVLPSLAGGHTADLRVDTGAFRLWTSRMDIADGEPFEGLLLAPHLCLGAGERAAQRDDLELSLDRQRIASMLLHQRGIGVEVVRERLVPDAAVAEVVDRTREQVQRLGDVLGPVDHSANRCSDHPFMKGEQGNEPLMVVFGSRHL